MTIRFHSHPRRAAASGFTLVEVAVALGIFVVAFVSIMALLPAGLGNLSDAGNKALKSQVIRTVSTELRQTPFAELKKVDLTAREFHFTNEGLPSPPGDPASVVTAAISSIEFNVPLNNISQGRVARATVVISRNGKEVDRAIVYLPDTGR